jgi:hypothetical protein
MRRAFSVISCTLLAATISACTEGGDPDDCVQPLAPVQVSASERSLSCIETVGLGDAEYEVTCANVRPELLGPMVAESTWYNARSVNGVPTSSALAVGSLDREGELVHGTDCSGWRFAHSYDLDRTTTDDLASTVTRPDGGDVPRV